MNLNEFAKEVHANAVSHGWWEEERSFGEIIALCHSELSEALEEYRAGRPMVWYKCMFRKGVCKERGCPFWDGETRKCEDGHRDNKPEGIAVEMADCIIRILDWFGKEGYEPVDEVVASKPWVKIPEKFGDLIAELHSTLSTAYEVDNEDEREEVRFYMGLCVAEVFDWAMLNDVDMEAILKLKHEYNKGRPYRHGGKAL